MTDWETRSLKFVVNAIDSAEKRQRALWKAIRSKRTQLGLIPIQWPAIEAYVESVRRTHSLMIDLEMVSKEYEAKKGKGRKPARSPKTTKKRRAK